METVKQWALTVAVSAVAGAITLMLAPEGALNKSARTAVSLFLIAAMLTPFVKGIEVSDFSFPEAEYEQTDLTDALSEQMKAAVKAKITEILDDCGIKPIEINIDISVDEEQMRIEKIEITAFDGGDRATAENRIKTEIGADVKIGVSG